MSGTRTTQSGRMKLIAIGAAVVTLLILSKILPLTQYTQQMLAWLVDFGVAGLVILAVVYVLACVLFFPGSLLTLGAGFLATTLWPSSLLMAIAIGTVTVSAGSVTGATAAFILGRTLIRKWVDEKISGNQKFRALDEAIAENGLKMVFLIRLSPAFPFNLLNYALGLTKVKLRDYILASWAGMLPGTVMCVYFGTLLKELTDLTTGAGENSASKMVFIGVGLALTVLLVVMVTRIAKKALDEAVQNIPNENSTTEMQGDAS